jgi:hypothetical protein
VAFYITILMSYYFRYLLNQRLKLPVFRASPRVYTLKLGSQVGVLILRRTAFTCPAPDTISRCRRRAKSTQPTGASGISGHGSQGKLRRRGWYVRRNLAPIGGKLGLNLRSSIRTDRSVAKCRGCKRIGGHRAVLWQQSRDLTPCRYAPAHAIGCRHWIDTTARALAPHPRHRNRSLRSSTLIASSMMN